MSVSKDDARATLLRALDRIDDLADDEHLDELVVVTAWGDDNGTRYAHNAARDMPLHVLIGLLIFYSDLLRADETVEG